MSLSTYHALSNPNVSWFCSKCDLPNFGTHLLSSPIPTNVNPFGPLSNLSPDTQILNSPPPHLILKP